MDGAGLMPQRPCITCGKLGVGSYCRAHQPSRRHPNRKSGGAQETFRRRVLKAAGERCQRCGAVGVPLQAHHVVGIAKGGSHEGEGVALCRRCHREVERKASG